jgi:hypothetical protein
MTESSFCRVPSDVAEDSPEVQQALALLRIDAKSAKLWPHRGEPDAARRLLDLMDERAALLNLHPNRKDAQ